MIDNSYSVLAIKWVSKSEKWYGNKLCVIIQDTDADESIYFFIHCVYVSDFLEAMVDAALRHIPGKELANGNLVGDILIAVTLERIFDAKFVIRSKYHLIFSRGEDLAVISEQIDGVSLSANATFAVGHFSMNLQYAVYIFYTIQL